MQMSKKKHVKNHIQLGFENEASNETCWQLEEECYFPAAPSQQGSCESTFLRITELQDCHYLENEEEMCKLKQDLGRRSTLSNVSRGSLFLWGDDHHQTALTWHLGGGMPICQEYGERQNTENWKEYPGKVPTVLRFDFYAEQKTHKVFMVEATTRAPHQSAVPLSGQEITFQKLNATALSIFLAENFQNWLSSIFFSKSNYHQEIPKLNANKKNLLFTWLNNWLKAKCRATSPCSHPLTKFQIKKRSCCQLSTT